MIIQKLVINNFRNHENVTLELDNKINIIYGNNGEGKTNILEALYVLGLTKSHRSFIDNNLIKEGTNSSSIKGIVKKNKIKTKFQINLDLKNKNMYIDNQQIKKLSDYISNINIIIFYPEDIELIKGSPSLRRRFLNVELSQLYSNYYNVLTEFYKILKSRNEYLKKIANKEKVDLNYLDILTEYLIDREVLIYKMRNKFISKINEKIAIIYKKLTNIDDLKISYITNINFENYETEYLKNTLRKKYKQIYEKEKKLNTTIIGPHRDDFDFIIDNKSIKMYGSQGQQRLSIIALKLTEIEIFKKYKETTPILLLDDVFSELDDNKKNNLLKYIKGNVQTIITTTEINSIDQKIIDKATLFNLKNGKLRYKKEGKQWKS